MTLSPSVRVIRETLMVITHLLIPLRGSFMVIREALIALTNPLRVIKGSLRVIEEVLRGIKFVFLLRFYNRDTS